MVLRSGELVGCDKARATSSRRSQRWPARKRAFDIVVAALVSDFFHRSF